MKTDVLIVGAGFAGASTACHLSRSFSGSILLVDREKIPGAHASGRNAALILQSTELAAVRRAVALSRPFYERNRKGVSFQQNGSFLLGSKIQLEKVREARLIFSEYRDPAGVRAEIPPLASHGFEAALWTPGDGVIDIAALLQLYLTDAQAHGVQLQFNCAVEQIRKNQCYQVETTRGNIQAGRVINASGAWAPWVAQEAGASRLPLTPLKRHLFVLGDVPQVKSTWPFAWNLDRNFYFRPEISDLLFSICDEERSENLEETVNPDIPQALAELICRELPALQSAVCKRIWSCFRTKARDGSFVIGWDPRLEGFFWVAGLGGHGVGASWQVGRIAAERFLQRGAPKAVEFSPARFE